MSQFIPRKKVFQEQYRQGVTKVRTNKIIDSALEKIKANDKSDSPKRLSSILTAEEKSVLEKAMELKD